MTAFRFIFQLAIVYIESVVVDFKFTFANVTFEYVKDKTRNPIIGFTIVSSKKITKIICYLSINLPEKNGDTEFRWELIKTVIDVGKLMNGALANPIIRSFMDNFRKSIDFDPRPPYKPVSLLNSVTAVNV